MKFFGKSRFSDFLEKYHPYASIVALIGIWLSQHYSKDHYEGFLDVSYPSTMKVDSEHVEHYKKGPNDFLFVFFCLNAITVIRFLYRKLILEPISRKLKLKPSLHLKFVDAGWFSLFHLVITVWGYIIFRDDEWWYNSPMLWSGYPHPFDYHTKYYYLVSLAFWLQSLFSFFFEPPRKDDKAFFFHHILTIGLMLGSYRLNFFRVGSAILLEQNAADIFYYSAKLVKYAGSDNAATAILAVFVVVWVYTRHFIFGWILYSLWFEFPNYIHSPGWDDVAGYYYVDWLYFVFVVALFALQGLMIYWFFLILRVIYRAVFLGSIADTTDASDSDEEIEVKPKSEKITNPKVKSGKKKVT